MAGRLGLRFAANYHVSPATVLEAVDAYREAFVPSADLDRPYVAVSADVVVGPDDEAANELAEGYPLWVLSIRSGQGAMPFPSPEEARRHHWTGADRALVRDRTETQFVGSPRSVASQLRWLQEATDADELLITTITHRHEDRIRSYRLLAEEWSKEQSPGGRPPAHMHYPAAREPRAGTLTSRSTRGSGSVTAPAGTVGLTARSPALSRRRWPPARQSAAMAASTSSFAARRAGQVAAPSPSSADRTRNTTRLATGMTMSVMPCCFSDAAKATPRAVPTTTPMMAPKRERMTDSDRIMARTWRRLIPTARRRPISWVRSNTDSMRVLTIPIEGDDHGQGQQGVHQPEELVDLWPAATSRTGPGSGSGGSGRR